MKKILLLMLLCAGLQGLAQTTYYWTGGATADWSLPTSWNTQLNGTGTGRTAAAPDDILIFNGSNIGGTTPATGTVTTQPLVQTIGGLRLEQGATVVLTRTSGTGSTTLTIGGVTGTDLNVLSGTTLTLAGGLGNMLLVMSAGTTGTIAGTMLLREAQTRFIVQGGAGAVQVLSGGTITAGTLLTTNPFSTTTSSGTPASDRGIQFQTGSRFIYQSGSNPFGSATTNVIVFDPGSLFIFETANVASMFNSRIFGDVQVRNNATVIGDAAFFNIGNLTIDPGATFRLNATGVAPITGNITNNGTFGTNPTIGSSNLALVGTTPQTVGGTGTFDPLGGITIGNSADVTLQRSIVLNGTATSSVLGKLNVQGNTISGSSNFQLRPATVAGFTATTTLDSYSITNVSSFTGIGVGTVVTGPGIQPNTFVIGTNSTGASFTINKPATATGTAVALSATSGNATLALANAGGVDAVLLMSGTKTIGIGANLIFNAASLTPLSTTISTGNSLTDLTANANITINRDMILDGILRVNGMITVPALVTVRITQGMAIQASGSNYIITEANTTTGDQGKIRVDNLNGTYLVPLGTATAYLPVTLVTTLASDFTFSVFQGITDNGLPNGTPLNAASKQTKVDAVWNINQVNGSGGATITLGWPASLEGSTFATLSNADIGVIRNNNPGWSLPLAPGNNATNIASASVTTYGNFGVGAQPPAQPFIFNPIPAKTYGDPDFNGGAISLNTAQPIVYTSSNPAVATIVAGNIHIAGAGTSTITAMQATDGFYPAVTQTQTLTVNKAPLTIKADDKAKAELDPNPALTATYTGFVLGETASVLLTPVTLATTAVTSSPAGTYPITASGATAANYNITFVPGTLTVTPKQTQTITFNTLPVKTYGNADFTISATSTSGLPVSFASSNPAVATVTGNLVHIVSAGTTTITASQAGNGLYFPATAVARTLTVNKANLTIRAVDTSRAVNTQNPVFRIIYTGFVLGETNSVLTTQPMATTPASVNSSPGYYPIELSGAASANYNITLTNGVLTVLPSTGTSEGNLQAYLRSANVMTVRVYATTADLADVLLFDMNGKLIAQRNVFLPKGFVSVDLSVSNIASGIYTVKVVGRDTKLTKTISIKH